MLGTQNYVLWKIKSQLNMACGSQKHTIEASEQNELTGKSKSHFAGL